MNSWSVAVCERYGENQFAKIENANNSSSSVISDAATNLTWMLEDSGQGLSWQEALAYCESSSHAGLTDWRLPNAHLGGGFRYFCFQPLLGDEYFSPHPLSYCRFFCVSFELIPRAAPGTNCIPLWTTAAPQTPRAQRRSIRSSQ